MANTKITSRVIADNAVTSSAIADGAITASKIASDAIDIVADTSPQLGGNLDVNGNAITGSTVQINGAGGELMISATENGPVALRYDNNLKLTTKSDGVDITGELQSDSLDVDGDADISGTIALGNLTIAGAQGTDGQVLTSTGSGVAWEDVAGGPTFKTFGTSSIMIGDTDTGTIDAANYNTGLGVGVFNALTSGDENVMVGFAAGQTLTTGSHNIGIGVNAIDDCDTGSFNVAIGTAALGANVGGYFQTAIGFEALKNTNYTPNLFAYSTAVGYQAGVANTTGKITAVGAKVLASNTTGINNAGFGGETDTFGAALQDNTTGSYNSAFGYNALHSNTTADNNTAVGYAALTANTTGYDNVAIGHNALNANTTGVANTALGTSALLVNTTASNNIAVGKQALSANTTGINNVAVGNYALLAQTTANANAIFGYNTGRAVTTGTSNTLLGKDAGEAITTGSYNTCVGRDVGANLTTGSFNTYVGYLAGTNNSAATNEIVIGAGNNFFVGKGNSTGFISPSGGGVYQGNNSSTWSTTSDRRIKKNIEDNNVGLDAIKQIQVRNFEYRTEDEIVDFEHPSSAVVKKEGIQLGVIAQEIEEILPDLVKTESTGVKSVNPDNLTWYLVNAVKELSAEVEELKLRLGD